MAITNINGNVATTTSTASASATKANDALGKDDFLKLLVAQLKSQDPLNPMEDKEFIAQMAQFTSLEQMKNMNTSVQITQATSFIGKQVTWADDAGVEKSGTVNAVRIVSGEPKVVIGEQVLALSKVLTVTEPTAAKTATDTGATV